MLTLTFPDFSIPDFIRNFIRKLRPPGQLTFLTSSRSVRVTVGLILLLNTCLNRFSVFFSSFSDQTDLLLCFGIFSNVTSL